MSTAILIQSLTTVTNNSNLLELARSISMHLNKGALSSSEFDAIYSWLVEKGISPKANVQETTERFFVHHSIQQITQTKEREKQAQLLEQREKLLSELAQVESELEYLKTFL